MNVGTVRGVRRNSPRLPQRISIAGLSRLCTFAHEAPRLFGVSKTEQTQYLPGGEDILTVRDKRASTHGALSPHYVPGGQIAGAILDGLGFETAVSLRLGRLLLLRSVKPAAA
jgi:hypothetical protein